jgi:undecaprenyl-diphosphatase
MSIEERKRFADILMAAFAAATFGWLAVERRSGATLKFDLAVRGGVHKLASPTMTAIARGLSTVGSPVVLPLLLTIGIVAFRRLHWNRAALALTAVMAVAVACNVGLKWVMHTARPEPFFGTDPSSYSFPSGHALFALSFYGVVAAVLAAHTSATVAQIGIWVGAALLALGIGLSRVYLGVHYPSDVVAGYLAAVFAISVVFGLLGRSSGCG